MACARWQAFVSNRNVIRLRGPAGEQETALARFVLVHGAFHGAWCWEPLILALSEAGHTTHALDLPGAGEDATPVGRVTLDAYAERICERLAEQPEPVTLVGHSMGGIAITQAAARCPERIARLVYVAAFLPADGQSLADLAGLPEGAGDGVQANMVVEGEPPVATMPQGAARKVFYAECAPSQATWALERLRGQPLAPFVTPVALGGANGDRPAAAYVVAARDRAVPSALQRRMAREGGAGDVVEIDTDHSPFLSRTGELAALLERFAAAGR
jgi:pimeloyl-ACP methyl ester carboxylesterase